VICLSAETVKSHRQLSSTIMTTVVISMVTCSIETMPTYVLSQLWSAL